MQGPRTSIKPRLLGQLSAGQCRLLRTGVAERVEKALETVQKKYGISDTDQII